jgi:hypothetical protein
MRCCNDDFAELGRNTEWWRSMIDPEGRKQARGITALMASSGESRNGVPVPPVPAGARRARD